MATSPLPGASPGMPNQIVAGAPKGGGPGDVAQPPGGPSPAPTGGGSAKPVAKLPASQFGKSSYLPQLDTTPLEMPNTDVNVEFCLEHMARVLVELAEKQEDPVWLESHRTLAEQWMTAAQMLLEHARESKGIVGDVELKQQQLYQQHELHQQTLSQNDQEHAQGIKQKDAMHQQQLKQNDVQHGQQLKQNDVLHQQKVKQGDDQHKSNLAMQKDKQVHQQRMMSKQAQLADQKARAKPAGK